MTIADPSQHLLTDHLYRCGVVAVLVVEDADDAVPLAKALLAGGVNSIELTLRTEAAMEGVRRICSEVPDMTVGVGTVLTPAQVKAVKETGAAFAVAPGLNPRVVSAANDVELPFYPGVCTPSDIELALELGCRVLKFFPSEPIGGVPYLKSMAAPYMHLGLRFIPLGGLHADNAESYLREPSVLALGGSWLGPREFIREKNWGAITDLASHATSIVQRVRGAQ